jgi:Na+/proline symporter
MQVKKVLGSILNYIGKLLIFSLAATVVAAVSFIFTGGFNANALSDRIFWAGMVYMMVAVVLVIAISSVGIGQGLPAMVRRPDEAKELMEKNLKVRSALEDRYDLCILLWLAGMSCLGISALVQVLSPLK